MADHLHIVDVGEVESLIISLYEPNPPEIISRNQLRLSRLQATPAAWQLARQLLERPNQKLQFFGVLTIIIKLNTEASTISDKEAEELIVALIGWYLQSVRNGSHMVSRKLASALSTFFLYFSHIWSDFMNHLVHCIATWEAHPVCGFSSYDTQGEIAQLDSVQVLAALSVNSNIVEDVAKLDATSTVNVKKYELVIRSSTVAAELMRRGIAPTSTLIGAHEQSIRCFQSWLGLTHRTALKDGHLKLTLHPILTLVIDLIPGPDCDIGEAAMDVVEDALTNTASFVAQEHFDRLELMLCSEWSRSQIDALRAGSVSPSHTLYGELLLSFGLATMQKLVLHPGAGQQELLTCLASLVVRDGLPLYDDQIFVPAIEFWCSFAEEIADIALLTQQENAQAVTPSDFLIRVVSHVWTRIVWPSSKDSDQLDSADRANLQDARREVIDLLQSTFTVVGPRIVTTFADLLLSAMHTSQWLEVDAAAYCLCGLADCAKEDERCDEDLCKVFSSQLLPTLQSGANDIPIRVRQTCASLIENYTEFFQRHVSMVSPVVNLLFASLAEPLMGGAASKSILRLCISCRDNLCDHAGVLFAEYQSLLRQKSLDCLSSERVLGAIAAVTQACPNHEHRVSVTTRLLGLIQNDVAVAEDAQQNARTHPLLCRQNPECFYAWPGEAPPLHTCLRALRGLVAMGKASSAPRDNVIDLVHGSSATVHSNREDASLIESATAHRLIMQIILKTERLFPHSTEVVELICNVLKIGFSEPQSGTFALPETDVAHYITAHTLQTPNISALVKVASTFISSVHKRQVTEPGLLRLVLLWVVNLLQTSPGFDHDPQLVQNAIDFVHHLLDRDPQVLLMLDPASSAEFFLLTTLTVLKGHEPLPKAAAADFWTAFITLRGGDVETQRAIDNAMITLGPMLADCLVFNISGQASRSELDKLCAPLKKLVVRYPKTKDWLLQSLQATSLPSYKVTASDKSMFTQKLVSLRGARGTNQVVRDFWLSCRGSQFSYTS